MELPAWWILAIYKCKIFNDKKPKIEYKRIFEENAKIQKDILERFRENFEKRNEIRNESVPLDPCDWSTVMTFSVITVMDNL